MDAIYRLDLAILGEDADAAGRGAARPYNRGLAQARAASRIRTASRRWLQR